MPGSRPKQTSFRQILGLGTSDLRRDHDLPPELSRRIARLHGSAIPCSGVVHLLCRGCKVRRRVAFRCDGKCTLCPRRADERGAALARMFPRVPVRHWVLTLPRPLRDACADDEVLTSRVARAFMREVFHLTRTVVARERGEAFPRGSTHCGGASLIHRAGSALDLNVHVHALALDGVYLIEPNDDDSGATATAENSANATFLPIMTGPTSEEVEALAERTLRSVDVEQTRRPRERQPPGTLGLLRKEAVRQHLAPGPHAKTSVRTVEVTRTHASVETTPSPAPAFDAADQEEPVIEAEHHGLRICATSQVDGRKRRQVLRLARYLTRPMVDLDAIEPTTEGTVRYTLERPFRDGTTHVEFAPRELAERLVALLPEHQTHRVAYHGVLAPRAAERWRVVPTQLVLIDEINPRSPRSVRRRKIPTKKASAETVAAAFACERCGEPMEIMAVEEGADGAIAPRQSA